MSRQHPVVTEAREQRRHAHRLVQRRKRQRRRLQQGQTLIIFALSITVLLGLAGLAVDVSRAYDLYARMQRAAEAGALAGALYMPNYYNTAMPAPGDGKSAVQRASEEIVKNGFGTVLATTASFTCPNVPTSTEVVICPVTGIKDDLRVTINETLSLVLMGNLGLQPVTLSASAESSYLPPVQIGSRYNSSGDSMECSPGNSSNSNTSACVPGTGNGLQSYLNTFNGPADLKESGDPMVYCEEGPAYLNPLGPDPNQGSDKYTTYNGYTTDHAPGSGVTTNQPISQYCGEPQSGGNAGNPDYQPDGYDGPKTAGTSHPGAYNYEISVAPDMAQGASLWIYNANFIPQDPGNNPQPFDHFTDCGNPSSCPNFYMGPKGEALSGTNGHKTWTGYYDAPLFYYNVTYTLYQLNSQYDRTSDALKYSKTYKPYDATSNDLRAHGCSTAFQNNPQTGYQQIPSQVYDPYANAGNTANTYHNPGSVVSGNGCVNPVTATTNLICMLEWCQFPYTLTPNLYRLAIEATGLSSSTPEYTSGLTDGWGGHSYGLKLCDTPNPASPINCGNDSNGLGAGQYKSIPNLAIFPWNNMDVIFQASLGTQNTNQNYPQTSCVSSNSTPYACVDLGCIPTDYAGRTITLKIFDVGDGARTLAGAGNIYVGVVAPSGTNAFYGHASDTVPAGKDVAITYPNWTTLNSSGGLVDGDTVVDGSTWNASGNYSNSAYRPLNGLWLDVTIKLAATYTGTCVGPSGWWQMVYAGTSNVQPTDKTAIVFSLVGSPVHLVPPTLG